MAYPPSTLPTNRTDSTPTPTNHPADHNNADQAINDIVGVLGPNPNGTATDLTSRLAALDTSSIEALAAVNLSGHRAVSPRADGTLEYADPTQLVNINRAVWLTTSAVSAGAVAAVRTMGEVIEPSWSWTPGMAVYLGANGMLTQTVPVAPSSAFLLELGTAITPTSLFFDPGIPIALS